MVEAAAKTGDNYRLPGLLQFMTSHLLLLFIGAALINNIVLVKILGLCPFMGVSKKLEAAISMGLATTFVLTLGSGSSYLIDHFLLAPFHLEYLRTLSFIVVIAGIVQFTEMAVQKTSPVLHQVLGIYLPLITTNCAVLGIPLINVSSNHSFVESLVFGFGGSIGFTLVLILFAGIRERLDGADVPAIFKGSAIAMITAGLMSLSFMGFSGLDK
jgi:electron transport complex protein RnfA